MIPTSFTQAQAPLQAQGPLHFHPPYAAAVVAPISSQKSLDPSPNGADPPEGGGGEGGRGGGARSGRPPSPPPVALFPRTISPARASLTQLGNLKPHPIHPTNTTPHQHHTTPPILHPPTHPPTHLHPHSTPPTPPVITYLPTSLTFAYSLMFRPQESKGYLEEGGGSTASPLVRCPR